MSQTAPSKVQAYLVAGEPIIASLDGEGARIVNEAGVGVICAAESPEELADVVKQLHDMSVQQCEQMAVNAVSYYQEIFEPLMLAKKLM